MFLLDYVTPENASGKIQEIYAAFPPGIGPPHPLQLISASPGFLIGQFEILKHYQNHKNLSFPLLTAIRYMAATHFEYDYCVNFNQNILQASGVTEQELAAVRNDPDRAPLEDHERAMLKFVSKAIRAPESIDMDDVEILHALGWEDADILDALAHGAYMQGHAILMKAFSKK